MKDNTKDLNKNTLLMVLCAILLAMKDDLNGDIMNTILQVLGSTTGLSTVPDSFVPVPGNAHPDSSASPTDYLYGIRGLANYLGVSDPTAQKYVNSGKLDPAIRRIGKKYSFMKAKVDEIFSTK